MKHGGGGGGGGGGGVELAPSDKGISGYNFPLFGVYPVDMPELLTGI